MFTLHNGDCLEYMKTLQHASVDCIVTDPPYGVAFRGNDWDNFIPNWIEQARSIAKVVIFTTGTTTLWDYPRPDWVISWYREASNSRSKLGGFSHWSPIVVYGNPKFKVDILKLHAMAVGQENLSIDHPSPKPVKLMKWLIQNASKEGDTIFDPFMGSGTTGVAAVQLQRNFIGCELEPKYFSIAESRIKSAALQPSLFTPSNNRLHWTGGDSPALPSQSTLEGFTDPEADTTPPASQ